jgi:hypothetical protein
VTVAELIGHLRSMPPDAIAVDSDELEIISVTASPDQATVRLWSEEK